MFGVDRRKGFALQPTVHRGPPLVTAGKRVCHGSNALDLHADIG